jgi:hypothetical protein
VPTATEAGWCGDGTGPRTGCPSQPASFTYRSAANPLQFFVSNGLRLTLGNL